MDSVFIHHGEWRGTKDEFAARVAALRQAKEAHKLTVGVPAPRDESNLVERVVQTGADYVFEPSPQEREEERLAIELAAAAALPVPYVVAVPIPPPIETKDRGARMLKVVTLVEEF